jgi:DNA helicase II / ATP-dependent DNA helicase PcrA
MLEEALTIVGRPLGLTQNSAPGESISSDNQQLAIEKTSGPCIIQAGPGTGKTETVVRKVRHLVEQGLYKPSEILCLTFSNEAADEIAQRVFFGGLKGANEIKISTFHSFCADVLRKEGTFIGINPDFQILEPDDAKVIFHSYLGTSGEKADRYVSTIARAMDFGIKLEQIQEYVDTARGNLRKSCADTTDLEGFINDLKVEFRTLYLRSVNPGKRDAALVRRKKEIQAILELYDEYSKYKEFVEAWKEYEKLKREKNYLDFADLITETVNLFATHGAGTFSRKYRYVIVDEFQDTNRPQLDILRELAGEHRNITAVGDQNQTIYGFRGARREAFSDFEAMFGVVKETDVFNLEKSYRCPDRVLRSARRLIQNNYSHPDEAALVENVDGVEGDRVRVIQLESGEEEARKVAELVEDEIKKGTRTQDICVLFRTHKQGQLLRHAFEAKGIPLATAGETDLIQTPEIRTVVSHLAILSNLRARTPTGEQGWWYLFRYRNALTPEDTVKIGRCLRDLHAKGADCSIDEALLDALRAPVLSKNGQQVVRRVVGRLQELSQASAKTIPDLVLDIYEMTGLNRRFTSKRTVVNVEAAMNLSLFLRKAQEYWDMQGRELEGFIEYLETIDYLKVIVPASEIAEEDAVRFMTVHAAKGLQFDAVIVTNLARDRFPVRPTAREPLIPKRLYPEISEELEKKGQLSPEAEQQAIEELEELFQIREDRRLCYVGMTRARKRLTLTFARSYNAREGSTVASVFLQEIGFENWDRPTISGDLAFEIDTDRKAITLEPIGEYQQLKSRLKDQLVQSLENEDFPSILSRLVEYHAVRDQRYQDYRELIGKSLEEAVDDEIIRKEVAMAQTGTSGLKFDQVTHPPFSPTALLMYDSCPKQYELAKIFRMPAREELGATAASLGSFIHEVLEGGVSALFSTEKQFIDLAAEKAKEEKWERIKLDDAKTLLRVFWRRNADSPFGVETLCEQTLTVKLDGYGFEGFADRIDKMPGDKVRIIDYKTSGSKPSNKERAWQLGFYAIAAKESMGLEPTEVILEMLKLEQPIKYRIEGKRVTPTAGARDGFDLDKVRNELVETAKKVAYDFEHEFRPVEDDGPCYRCGYKFYCPKWEEG